MFINDIKITKTIPCIAEEGSLQVWALASTPMTEILPYLNAILKKTSYDHKSGNLTFMVEKKVSIRLHEDKIVLRKIANVTAAYEMLDWLKDLCNDTYERMDEITPMTEPKKVISIMDFYRLLPRTNCKKCGYPACMAFANALYQEDVVIEDCPPITEQKYQEKYEKLKALV